MLLSAILLAAAAAGAEGTVDVEAYRISATVGSVTGRSGELLLLRKNVLKVTTEIDLAGDLPERLFLELAPEMKVLPNTTTARVGEAVRSVPVTAADGGITLDLAGARGAKTLILRCEGTPSERFPMERGGFVRTAITDDVLYIRSQVAWYPRVPGVRARHLVVFNGRDGWLGRSAGESGPGVSTTSFLSVAAGLQDRVGLVSGPWKAVVDGPCEALVFAGREKAAAALLPLARKTMEFHASDLGPLARKGYTLVEMPKEFGTGSGYSECGYILLGPGAFDAGPKADWVPGFLAHEAAHQWWGQDGFFSDFASEGLAEYSTYRFVRATSGADAAGRMRRAAADRVSKAAMGGKAAALADVRGWGEGMDPETYRATAYEKTMLLLAAVEDAVGPERMTALLREFLGTARKTRVGWSDLRFVLVAAGPEAKAAVERWEGKAPPKDGALPPPPAAEADAKARLEAGMKVANSPAEAGPKVLGKAIEDLRAARESKDLSDGEKAAARTGIGRCLFRLGKLDEAEKELTAALAAGGGGPFHRGWIELHLGNIDDLRGRRKEALAHYKAVLDNKGASATTVAKAKAFTGKPYRGFDKDG